MEADNARCGQCGLGVLADVARLVLRAYFAHYEYTLDEKYLRETAYPIMKKAAEFYCDYLVEDRDGYLIAAPSTSPENNF